MEKKYDVFISYSRKDYLMDDEKTPAPEKIVSKILNVLDKHNISYWIDKEGMYSSVQFAAVIEEQISDARCFLFVSTQASNASRYTLGEVFTAVDYEKPIIPFRADDSKFGKGIGFHLRPLDHIEYFKTGGDAFDKLVASIKHIKAEQLYDQLIAEYKSIASEYKSKLRAKSDEMKSLGITPPADGMADEEALQKIKVKYEQKISICHAEKANLMETVQDLQQQLETAKSEAQEILHQSKATEDTLRDEIHEISFKLAETGKALAKKECKISSLEKSLSSTTDTLDNVQRELQKYKDAEAKQKAAEEARKKEEAEASKKAEIEARRKAEEEKKHVKSNVQQSDETLIPLGPNNLPSRYILNGKYQIVKVIGNGGFANTYLANHMNLRKYVAIKEYYPKFSCSRDGIDVRLEGDTAERFKQSFMKEAEILSRLNHPNIIKVFDCFEQNNTIYYAMEYVEGENLFQLRRKTNFSQQTIVNVLKSTANALTYIHSQGFVHGDIAPHNILLDKNSKLIKIIDVCAQTYSKQDDFSTTVIPPLVRLGYSAIERYSQGTLSVIKENDIYSLGALTYFLITGQRPPESSELLHSPEILETELAKFNAHSQLKRIVMEAMRVRHRDRVSLPTIIQYLNSIN